MDPLLEHATGLFKGRLNCHAPGAGGGAIPGPRTDLYSG